jgi:integral membrane protein
VDLTPADLKTATAMRRLRLVSAPEAVTFLVLLVCVVLKSTTSFNAVPTMGWVHGIFFILYAVFWLDSWNRVRWGFWRAVLYIVLSALPFGGFVAERMLAREGEAFVVAARGRAAAAGSGAEPEAVPSGETGVTSM